MFQSLIERVASAFANANVPYMIIGGQAVLLYGEPRLTKDIDIAIGVTLDRLGDVLGLVQAMDLKPLVDPTAFTQETMVLPCADTQTGIRVDLIFASTRYEQQAMSRVNRVKFEAAEVCFAALEDLMIHKIIAGRPRDIEDVKNVLVKSSGADLGYIRCWLSKFSDALSESYVSRFDDVVTSIGR